MQGNNSQNKIEHIPGPGQYNPTVYCKTVIPAYAIPKAKRMVDRNPSNPGPGSYNLSSERSGPQWKVGTEKRLTSSSMDFPGPGTYECGSESSMPAFSMTARRPVTSDTTVPGPGAYTPRSLFTQIQYSVGNSAREGSVKDDVPGPASYFIGSPKSRAAVFGSSKRKFVIDCEKNPGPGSYEQKASWDGPKFTLRSRNSYKSVHDTPVIYK